MSVAAIRKAWRSVTANRKPAKCKVQMLFRLFQQRYIRLLANASDTCNRQIRHWVNRQTLKRGDFLATNDLEVSFVLVGLEPLFDHIEAPMPALRNEGVEEARAPCVVAEF